MWEFACLPTHACNLPAAHVLLPRARVANQLFCPGTGAWWKQAPFSWVGGSKLPAPASVPCCPGAFLPASCSAPGCQGSEAARPASRPPASLKAAPSNSKPAGRKGAGRSGVPECTQHPPPETGLRQQMLPKPTAPPNVPDSAWAAARSPCPVFHLPDLDLVLKGGPGSTWASRPRVHCRLRWGGSGKEWKASGSPCYLCGGRVTRELKVSGSRRCCGSVLRPQAPYMSWM